MFPKEYRSRDVISLYYGGEIIASNKVNQVIEDALKSDKERKFVETIEVAINLRDVDLQNPQKRINAEVALPHGRGPQYHAGDETVESLPTRETRP